jgi:cysteine desulfurase
VAGSFTSVTDSTAAPQDTGAGGDFDAGGGQPLHPAAREAWLAAVDAGYADPLALHRPGRAARLVLDNARAAVAEALGTRPDEVSFTGSGAEAIHRGLLGLLEGRARTSRVLVHSAVEQATVLRAAAWWCDRAGGSTRVLPVTRAGAVDVDALPGLLSGPEPGALAVQAANPEVGTVQPLEEVADRAAAAGVPLFVDLAAAAGRLDPPTGWAAAAASAHTWGGPPGVGILLVRHGARWRSALPTDERTDPRVAGLENVPGALAAAAALQATITERGSENPLLDRLVERIRGSVARLPDVEVVGDPQRRLPHVVTFSCLYLDGEQLVRALDQHGFSVGSGSACTAATVRPSHVLEAMGVLTHGNVRVSLARGTTEEQVERFLAVLPGVLERMRRDVPLPRHDARSQG